MKCPFMLQLDYKNRFAKIKKMSEKKLIKLQLDYKNRFAKIEVPSGKYTCGVIA